MRKQSSNSLSDVLKCFEKQWAGHSITGPLRNDMNSNLTCESEKESLPLVSDYPYQYVYLSPELYLCTIAIVTAPYEGF